MDEQTITVIGLDPGYVNFGWSISCVRYSQVKNSVAIKILEYGTIKNTIKNLSLDLNKQVSDFSNELFSLINKHDVKYVVAERFQARGFKGISVELINSMLGIMVGLLHDSDIDYKLILPSTWKNAAGKQQLNLKSLYGRHKAYMSPHEIDASIMSIYGGYITVAPTLKPLKGLANHVNRFINKCPTTISKVGHVLFDT